MPTATLADLQTKAGYVLDLANKLLVDNAQPIHQTLENVEIFSIALADNSDGVNAALKGVADLGKTIEPLASRLQSLSDDADKLVKAIDTEKVRTIVDNVQSHVRQSQLGSRPRRQVDRGQRRRCSFGAVERQRFRQDAERQSQNVEAALKGFADVGKAGPAAWRSVCRSFPMMPTSL